jgi:cobalt-zinc-cadmium resistance protein CzcA
VRGRDIGSFVKEAQKRIGREIALPVGYTIEWGGQFEHLERAERRLYVVVPLALALILSLLYLTFHSLRDAVMIFSGVLFARVGGILGLYVMGLPFTILADDSSLEGPHGVRYVRACGDLKDGRREHESERTESIAR